jgi:hypothetical protein
MRDERRILSPFAGSGGLCYNAANPWNAEGTTMRQSPRTKELSRRDGWLIAGEPLGWGSLVDRSAYQIRCPLHLRGAI